MLVLWGIYSSFFCKGHRSQSVNRGKKKALQLSLAFLTKPKFYFNPYIVLGRQNWHRVFPELWLSSRDIQQAKAMDLDQLALCHHPSGWAGGQMSFLICTACGSAFILLQGFSLPTLWPSRVLLCTQGARNSRLWKSQMSMQTCHHHCPLTTLGVRTHQNLPFFSRLHIENQISSSWESFRLTWIFCLIPAPLILNWRQGLGGPRLSVDQYSQFFTFSFPSSKSYLVCGWEGWFLCITYSQFFSCGTR